MKARELQLPTWASVIKDASSVASRKVGIVIEADPDGFMPAWLESIGAPMDTLDQYWLECAYQCAKLELQSCLSGTAYQPSACEMPAEIRIKNRPFWALKNWPPGAGVQAATMGLRVVPAGTESGAKGILTARAHYIRVRGSMPQL